MSDANTEAKTDEFTERLWKLIEKHMGCRVPMYVKNILKLRGFDNAASIKTLSDEDYKAFETFARTKMEKFIPSASNREDYYHIFSKEPHAFEILPGHIRLLNEIVKYITVMTDSHDQTFFDPDSHFGNEENSIGQSEELFKSNEKVDYELDNSKNHSIGRSQPLFKSNERVGCELGNSVNNSIGRSQQMLKPSESYELKYSVNNALGRSHQMLKSSESYDLGNLVNDSIGRSQLLKSNKIVHEFGYSGHNLLRRTQSNNIECGRNFEQLQQRQGDLEIMQALLQNSTKLDSYRSGENCYVSHVNSIYDFYIQMESDTDALEKLAQYLTDAPQFDVLTDIKEGVVCAAKYLEEELWYRAKIMSHTADSAEVFFIDYGNSSLTNQLRIIPPPISTAPSLAKHCSMVKPKNILFSSVNAEERFLELNDNETNFMVEVISPGPKSIVNLFVNQKSFLEEISCLSDKHSLNASQTVLQSESNAVVAPESVEVLIVDGSVNHFYIHLKSSLTKLYQLWDSMQPASTWPILEEGAVGQLCAAFFGGDYYRAKILSLVDEGATVHYVDYGNKSISTDLRQLPDNLYNIQPIAILCCLKTENGSYSPQLVKRFENLSRENVLEMRYVSENSIPAIVELFENGVQIIDKSMRTSEPNDSNNQRPITKKILPSLCQIQLDNDMEETNKKKISKQTYTVEELKKIISNFKPSTILEKQKREDDNQNEKNTATTTAGFGTVVVPLANQHIKNGEGMFNRLKDVPSETPKFIEAISSFPKGMLRSFERKIEDRTSREPPKNDAVDSPADSDSDSKLQNCAINTTTYACKSVDPENRPDHDDEPKTTTNSQNNHQKHTGSNGSDCLQVDDFTIHGTELEFCKNQDYVQQSFDSRRETLSPEGVIDPHTQIQFEEISINNTEEVTLSWFISPLEFYVSTTKNEADLIMQMKNIYHFYKNKLPITEKVELGSFVIAKFSQDNQLYRAQILDYNEKLNKYKALLIDVGARTTLDAMDIYEMDKYFAKFERRGIMCSLLGVALRTTRLDVQNVVEKYFADKKLVCNFINRKGDKYYVDIEVDGINVKQDLIMNDYLSVLSEDIEMERLVGQTVMAKIVSIKDFSSLQLIIFGCETIFEVSCKDSKLYSESKEIKELPVQLTIPVRIDSLLIGQIFAITPLIDTFGESPSLPIVSFPFFCNHFKVLVTYWESYNVAYVQSVNADNFEQSVINELFEYYHSNGDVLDEFIPETLCAVKSADENWYRAEIISVAEIEVKVRYLDYGNCEIIPKALVKRLESRFLDISALAIKVHLPLKDVHKDREISVDDIDIFTSHIALDLTVLAYHAENWIVDLSKDDTSIMSYIKTTTCCETLTVDELKEQWDNIQISGKVTPQLHTSSNNLQDETKSKVSLIDAEMPNVSQNIQHICKNTSKISAYISHVDRPDRFYLQVASKSDELELDLLQKNIQMAAPTLPPLEGFSADTRCIVRYSVDDQWYRGVIIDSDTRITSVSFMDYGNTDTITDNSLIKSTNETFDEIPPYAIPCALPLEAKNRHEWSEESCQLLKDLVNEEVEFEYVCKGKANNFVKLYHGERDIMQELIQNGYAIKLNPIKSGENCYVSHVNSIADFYIQMESDTDVLKKLAQSLTDAPQFDVLTHIEEGVVCAAKFMEDGLWYRAKIMSRTADNTEVFFIDYGNSSLTNELRIIPPEIANAPSLAKHCSMVKPEDVQCWSENAEERFFELCEDVSMVDVISPGKKSIVDLFVNEKSILEEISNLCDKYSLSASQQSFDDVPSEIFKALIVDGSPDLFYIQLERTINELYLLWDLLEPAATWPILEEEEVEVGQLCAAIFEGIYYRAKILLLNDEGATVEYIDYGNKSISTDLRKLPNDLQITEPLAIKCSLESKNGIFSPQLVERFNNLSRDDLFEMKYVSKNSIPVIQLFENGELFADEPTEISEPTQDTLIAAYITAIISPSHFYIQLNNDMEEAMTSAADFPLLEDGDICVGTLCAAFWKELYYRAEILSVDEQGIMVHFIDNGNESYATDLRKLPHDLEKIERASLLCTLESGKKEFSDEFLDEFSTLDLDKQHLFEIVYQSNPCVVRFYKNELNDQENDHVKPANNSIVEEIINELIEKAENRYFAN